MASRQATHRVRSRGAHLILRDAPSQVGYSRLAQLGYRCRVNPTSVGAPQDEERGRGSFVALSFAIEDKGILPDRMIAALAAAGGILPSTDFVPDQIQPASLDLRLGEVAYRVRASFLPGRTTVAERIDGLKLHEISLSDGAVLETGCVYIVPLLESLALPDEISAAANPKSSTGRLDVFTRVIADETRGFDRIEAGYHGPLYAEISPRTFPVLVREGSRLSQIRFRRGHAVLDFWEPMQARPDKSLILDPNEFYILASKEAVQVPPDYAAEMVPFDPLVGEFRVHYAGFFDPGFGYAGAGGKGARAVLEVRSREVPFILEHGQIVGRLVYEKMIARPDKLYGSGIGSNYQAQSLKLSKHFKA